jgi:hypothetical protein
MKKVFQAYTDPGHGWVKVPKTILVALNIADKITAFSYQRGEYAYLEEDCDVSTFVAAYEKKNGMRPTLKNRHTNKQSRIRQYEDYKHA